ncbi:MAG TPA: septum formation initiator family protein [Chloroflexota bacterium]|nr:septum formation initiator family protein [Chloroflexota bacterium]
MQILLLLVLTVALYFAAAFSGELITSQRIDREVASISADIDRLRAENTRLKAAVAEASSDAFVEREARERLGLVRPGDVPVVVTNAPTPAPPPPKLAPRPKAHWEKWQALLRRT